MVIIPPDSPPGLIFAITYEGSGKYERTFPFERSTVAILNDRSIPLDAQIKSVENWLIGKERADEPMM